jgi:hypothetical protein
VWPALVEEDGGGISVDAMLVANALVHRTIHRSKVHRAPYQGAGLSKNTVCHVNTLITEPIPPANTSTHEFFLFELRPKFQLFVFLNSINFPYSVFSQAISFT